MNPFGKKLEYNPVPPVIHWEITGREQSGKTSLVAKLAKPGIVVVIDADGRFSDSVPENSSVEFYPLSDNKSDMLDPDKIASILDKAQPKTVNVSMIVVDTLTNILEPIIQRIQASKQYPSIYDYRPKSEATKKLRHSFSKWNCETAWLYHIVEYVEKENGEVVTKEKGFLSDLEYGRLGRAITISLQVVVNDNGVRGVKVVQARRGRIGFILWDDSGTWENIRQRIETAVWGGLSQTEQEAIEQSVPESFEDAGQAIRWACQYASGVFKDEAHAKNSLNKLHVQLKDQLGSDYDRGILWQRWTDKVLEKMEDHE